MYRKITGIILSGGRSSRMGSDKGLMEIAGRRAIERTVDLMAGLFPELILSTNSPRDYRFLGLPMVEDLRRGIGPLAGLHAGLRASPTDRSFAIPCDVQLMTEEVNAASHPVTVARADGIVQRLPGLFHRSCLVAIEEMLAAYDSDQEVNPNGKLCGCSLGALFDRVGINVVDAETEIPGYVAGTFSNMNGPQDVARIRRLLEPTLRRPRVRRP